jgi:WD40 repeat protein
MSMLSVSSNQDGSLGDNVLGEDAPASSSSSDATAFMHCLHVLCGHETAVISVSYSSDMDLILSGSVDGLICLHSARKGKLIRSIHHMQGASVDVITLISSGYVVAHSWETLELHLFWINGQALMMIKLAYRIECIVCNANSANVIVCGCSDGVVSFRTVWNLEEIHSIAPNDSYLDKHHNREDTNGEKDETRMFSKGAVTCLWFSDDSQHLFVGYEDGSFSVGADADSKWKALNAAV